MGTKKRPSSLRLAAIKRERRRRLVIEGLEDRSLLSVTPPAIVSISPSLDEGTIPYATRQLVLAFDQQVVGGHLSQNFELRNAGPDGLLGNTDDQIVPLLAGYVPHRSSLGFDGLEEGTYRLTAKAAIQNELGQSLDGDGDGISGDDWRRDFVVLRGGAESIRLVSEAYRGATGDKRSEIVASNRRSISDDGRYVVFQSLASDLNRNGSPHVKFLLAGHTNRRNTTFLSTIADRWFGNLLCESLPQ